MNDYLQLVTQSLLHRKLRSWLTIVAIVIGIASVVALIAISQSLQNSIEEQFEVFGADKIFILPASVGVQFNRFTGLTTEDFEAVERVSDLEEVIPWLSKTTTAEFKNDEQRINFLIGIPADKTDVLFDDFGIKTSQGRFFTQDSFQIVFGPLAAENLFDDEVRVKNRVKIEGKKFEVVGILEAVGNPEDDNNIYIPLAVMRDLFDDKDTVSFIQAKVRPGKDINDVAKKVIVQLKKVRDEEEFDVVTAEQLLAQLGAVLGIIQAVLVSIAAISLIVGGVGITNVMYTSVLERTREIGIMKSVGATNKFIMTLFVLEAGIMGFVGGVLGTVLGILIAQGVGAIAAAAGWDIFKVTISPLLVVFGLLFSTVVGMLSGALPARQASKLKVVDALRYGK